MMFRHQLYVFRALGKYVHGYVPGILGVVSACDNSVQQVRCYKHWNPKFKKQRREKFIKIDLPNYEQDEENMPADKVRSILKEHGLLPQKRWMERPIYISSTSSIFESYVPPEGDGKFSMIMKEGAKQKLTNVSMKSKSIMAIRKIKSFDDTFDAKAFAYEAMDIYTKAHETLAKKDIEKLREYVTETAYSQMLHNIMNKTIHWKLIQSLEPPRVVHARCTHIITEENVFAQITVRLHTEQVLSIYDRFGRLIQGSEIIKKDVLEYIVFEKHLANEYGVWRLHGKIIPSWMPPREVYGKTFVLPKEEEKEKKEEVAPQAPVQSTATKQDTIANASTH